MKQVLLIGNRVAFVDDADFDFINQWQWRARKSSKGRTYYAIRYDHDPIAYQEGVKYKRTVLMHREILKTIAEVDHRDGDGLNNTRSNLRPASHEQNMANRGPQRNNRSGLKGVWWYPRSQKWVAMIKAHGVHKNLGYFESPVDAAKKYNEAALAAWGEFAVLNQI